jgi:extradiol dioxygenase family protein
MGKSPSASPLGLAKLSRAEQSALRLDRQDPYLRLHCVTIFVRDQDRSLRFYVEQLGFSLVGDIRLKPDYRWVAVAPPDGSAILALVAPKPDSQEYKLIGRPTQVVFVTEDVLAKFKEWRQRGVRFQSTPRLRRIQYERRAPAQSSTDPSVLPGEQAPVWGAVLPASKMSTAIPLRWSALTK